MRLRTLIELTPTECGLLLLAVPVVAAIRVGLWVLPSPTIVRALRRFESANAPESISHAVPVKATVWAIEAAARRIPKASCLTQALAASVLLRWFGYSTQLCLGVAPNEDGSLRAHAWLERSGRAVLGGAGAQMLTRLPRLSDASHISALPSLTR